MNFTKVVIFIFGLHLTFISFAGNASIFGSVESKSDDIEKFYKWKKVLTSLNEEDDDCQKKLKCPMQEWISAIMADKPYSKELDILKSVNSYVNKVKYIKDSKIWGKSDYWATPSEFFAKGGDCEDYVIAKFAILKKIGFSANNMRLVVLENMQKKLIHSILVVNLNGKDYVLDNERPHILTANEINHYKPIYSINEASWWKHSI
jgi:predicted transglutaminase-like cysteine proteinase